MGTGQKKEPPSYQETYKRLRKGYVERLQKSILEADGYLALAAPTAEQLKAIQKFAHGLAGSGAIFGFPAVTEAGRALDAFLDKPLSEEDGRQALHSLLSALKEACVSGVQEGEDAPAPAAPEKPPFRLVRDPYVVIVEDDADFAAFLTYRLKQHRIRSRIADCGAQMEATLAREAPDLVLLDISLPDVSGHELLQALKSNPRTARTPVLMVTGKKKEEDVIGALNAGAIGYIVKGDDPDTVISHITKHIARLRPTVLIADGDVILLGLLDRKFSASGFHVLLAEDGEKAMEVAAVRRPDLIVFDRRMPKVRDLDMLRLLRADPATQTIPVIMLGARAEDDGLHGADEYLPKPFDSDRLVERAIHLLRMNSTVE